MPGQKSSKMKWPSEHVVQGQEHHESGAGGGQDGAEPKQAAVMDGAKGGKSKQQDTKEILKGYRERAICIVSGELLLFISIQGCKS